MNFISGRMRALIDTGFLLATMYQKDQNHQAARQALRDSKGERLIVVSVLPEIFYMTTARISYERAVKQFELLTTSSFTLVELTSTDYIRMAEIMKEYKDNEFDFVDVSQMAISERLNIKSIYTFDHRDFSVFRPKHCDYLELLPHIS